MTPECFFPHIFIGLYLEFNQGKTEVETPISSPIRGCFRIFLTHLVPDLKNPTKNSILKIN